MNHVSEADLCEITEAIWSTMLDLRVERRDAVTRPGGEPTLAGCVLITGAFDGAVVLECSAALARQVTARIFDVHAAAATPGEAQDALAELVNVTGGNVKALLAEPSQLSLPVVAHGHEMTARLPGSRTIGRAAFECLGEPLVVSVHEREREAPGA